jgi:hypothetical protein
LAYQPPASSTFLSEQTSHQQPASSTFLSEQISSSQTNRLLSEANTVTEAISKGMGTFVSRCYVLTRVEFFFFQRVGEVRRPPNFDAGNTRHRSVMIEFAVTNE